MRIENFQRTRSSDAVRISADVVWEDSLREPFPLFYETDAQFANDVSDDANAFLLSAAISASRDGERRILLEQSVSPRLVEGVTIALSILRRWYGGRRTLPRIESRAGFREATRTVDRAALCLTGGVDSMHMLWWNRAHYATTHPRAFREAIYVVHLSFPDGEALPRARDVARRQLRALSGICEDTGLELRAVRTNVRLIEPTLRFTQAEGLGSLLAAAAHVQSGGLSSLSIASSSYEASDLRPWGTHPHLDPNFSSEGVAILHEDGGLPRSEKVRRIARWDPALKHLFVCFEGPLPDSRANCGRCEKCLRTMIALLAVSSLEQTKAFGDSAVTPEAIRQVDLSYDPNEFSFLWKPLERSMEEIGRRDLAAAIRRRLAESRRYLRWRAERDWKGVLRRLDRRLLRGTVTKVSRRIRGIDGGTEA
jgi:hypothetical protein